MFILIEMSRQKSTQKHGCQIEPRDCCPASLTRDKKIQKLQITDPKQNNELVKLNYILSLTILSQVCRPILWRKKNND